MPRDRGFESDGATRRERLLYFLVVPAICLAVLILGAVALRATLQIEKARQNTVIEATLSLASERVDRLDKMIIAQDNVAGAAVDLDALSTIETRWLPTAARETPTVRAIVVLDATQPEMEVRAFASRRTGPEDDLFRRMLIARMVPKMKLTPPVTELRHLHQVVGDKNYLLSYWQRERAGRRYLIVAWHNVPSLVLEVMPQLYQEIDRGSRMNVVDERGRILYGPPIQAGSFTVGLPFPTTLYNWRLQVALTGAEELAERAVQQRLLQLGVVGLAALIAIVGTVIVVRTSQQQRRLAQLKSDFVANVSHELKTPLASVRMFGEMLATGRVASDAKRDEYLSIIVGESERLSNLIDNVLDFAKVEGGKHAYDFREGDVAEVVGRAVEIQRYRADRQKVELLLDAEPAVAHVDARAVELAVINLLDNALKYATGTEWIRVTVTSDDDDGATIRVEDRGPGIAPAEQERIFDRFVRGAEAGQKHVRGSGIGLALVKHIADSHGGTVEVQSPIDDEGKGTAFVLRLPEGPPA